MQYRDKREYGKIIRETNLNWVCCTNASKKKLATLHAIVSFEQDKYDKGLEWYNSGLGIEDAPVELQNNRSFVDGFKRGHRLALIEELTSKNKSR